MEVKDIKNDFIKQHAERYSVNKDSNDTILIYFSFTKKDFCVDIQPQCEIVSDDIYKNHIDVVITEVDEHEEKCSLFRIDITLDVYSKYIGMSNINFAKNKEELYIFIYKSEFDYENYEELFSYRR